MPNLGRAPIRCARTEAAARLYPQVHYGMDHRAAWRPQGIVGVRATASECRIALVPGDFQRNTRVRGAMPDKGANHMENFARCALRSAAGSYHRQGVEVLSPHVGDRFIDTPSIEIGRDDGLPDAPQEHQPQAATEHLLVGPHQLAKARRVELRGRRNREPH